VIFSAKITVDTCLTPVEVVEAVHRRLLPTAIHSGGEADENLFKIQLQLPFAIGTIASAPFGATVHVVLRPFAATLFWTAVSSVPALVLASAAIVAGLALRTVFLGALFAAWIVVGNLWLHFTREATRIANLLRERLPPPESPPRRSPPYR